MGIIQVTNEPEVEVVKFPPGDSFVVKIALREFGPEKPMSVCKTTRDFATRFSPGSTLFFKEEFRGHEDGDGGE